MKFFEQAYQMEKDVEQYYRTLAEKCSRNEGIKTILILLANEHNNHAIEIKQLQADTKLELKETEPFLEVKKILVDMHNKREMFQCDMEQENLYKKALDLVVKKEKLYLDALSEADSDTDKEVLKHIAEDERKHRFVLEDIIEMVTRPSTWVENAEFIHFDEY